MRNRAEKQRRDKLNAYISELYSLVPSAAAAPRKLDKTSTLRLSANFLRIHQSKMNSLAAKHLNPVTLLANFGADITIFKRCRLSMCTVRSGETLCYFLILLQSENYLCYTTRLLLKRLEAIIVELSRFRFFYF